MNFLKVGLFYSASTISKMFAGLLIVKIIAVTVGADGLGRLGQFMSLMAMINIMAGGGITSGIVKYVSEFKNDPQQLKEYVGAASLVAVIASLLAGVGLFAASGTMSTWLFKTDEYKSVIEALAFVQFLIAFVNLITGLVNGHQRVRAFAAINAVSVLLGAGGVALGCAFYGLRGAMVGLMWMAACPLLFLLPWFKLRLQFDWKNLYPRWNKEKIGQFLHFTLMVLVSVLTMQLTQILIREIIEHKTSWVHVGYWQAVSKISDVYLQFITVVLANYFLPRLAELKSTMAIKREVDQAYKYAMPVLVTLSLMVYLCRDPIILLLFSRDFLPMKEFFTFQLIGDSFKIAAYIGAYVAIAKANTKLYIAAEVFQASMLIGLCIIFVDRFGAVGATYAYCLNYAIYFLVVNYLLRRYFRKAK